MNKENKEIKKSNVVLQCDICLDTCDVNIEIPYKWGGFDGHNVGDNGGFCPKHAEIEEFTHQCSGCVGSWGDCPLWRAAFADPVKRTLLTSADLKTIRSGVCPKRVDGMIYIAPNSTKNVVVKTASRSSKRSGIALEKAIKDYWKRNLRNHLSPRNQPNEQRK